MSVFECVKSALNSIRANRMRSFLTMLGIIIGISSVITIVSLGQGGQNQITGEFEKIGAATVSIKVDTTKAQPTDYITLDDVRQIKEKIDSIKYVSPELQKGGTIATENKDRRAYILGGTPDLNYVNNNEILYGRYFNEREYEQGGAVGIIDENAAKSLFGYSDAVGNSVKISFNANVKKVTIIGVKKGYTGPFMGGNNENIPVTIEIPATFYMSLQSGSTRINSISVVANTKEDIEAAGNSTIKYLENKHSNLGKEIYSADSVLKMLDQVNKVLGVFTSFIGAVAAISLLVGGIGVMNIMLVSVTERTREIGIRKSIGATTGIILFQFLVESVIISLIGGIIGMIIGIIGANLIGNYAGITPKLSLEAILGSILFSSAVGIFFGIYPAKKAAKLDPIDALRYE